MPAPALTPNSHLQPPICYTLARPFSFSTVHGTATEIDMKSPEQAGFRKTLLDIYVPRYGESWADMLESGAIYWRIDAERMFTYAT